MKTAVRIPKKAKNLVKTLKFLNRAVSRDTWRERMGKLYYAEKVAVSIDGKRLHMAQVDLELENGLYYLDIGKEAATLIFDTETLISDYPKFHGIVDNARKLPEAGTVDLGYVNLYRNSVGIGEVFHLTGKTIQMAFLRDICGYEWRIFTDKSDGHSAVRFLNNDGLEAIIMPMQRD